MSIHFRIDIALDHGSVIWFAKNMLEPVWITGGNDSYCWCITWVDHQRMLPLVHYLNNQCLADYQSRERRLKAPILHTNSNDFLRRLHLDRHGWRKVAHRVRDRLPTRFPGVGAATGRMNVTDN